MEVSEENAPTYERTRHDMEQILGWADLGPDLDRADLLPEVQCLSFTDDLDQNNDDGGIKLLEVDPAMLELLKVGQTLTIRGDEEEPSVLCTQGETYEIRTAETSNGMLVVPTMKLSGDLNQNVDQERYINPVKILGGLNEYRFLELKSCPPKLRKLTKLLQERPYFGKDSDRNTLGFLWEEFLNRIQCSELQLKGGLESIKAYEIGEYWYLLDLDYHFNVLSSILNLIDAESYSIDNIDKTIILDTLNRAHIEPSYILDQCFDYFFVPSEEGSSIYHMKKEDVSKFSAQILLKSANKFNLDEFLTIWRSSVPQGVVTEMHHLKGLAIVEASSNPKTVFYFPADQLSNDVSDSFNNLFDVKNIWTESEIEPYLRDFCSAQTSLKYFLTRYTRSYLNDDGVKCFASKHVRY